MAAVAGFLRLDEIAELANAGTLCAFIAVGLCLMVLRSRRPDLVRVFTCPVPYVVAALTIFGCFYLMINLPGLTLVRFVLWNVIGFTLYWLYGRSRSLAARGAELRRDS